MFKYILRRLLIMIPVLIGLTIVVFLLVNVLPGDTARIIAGDYADEATVQSIREAYGLDKPIHIQYINYIKDLLHGDFGRSYHSRRDIATELANVYPKTITLALATEVVGIVLGVMLGMIAAVRRGSLVDRGVTAFGVLGLSIPQFWFALILQLLFAVTLQWLPPSGYGVGFDRYIILPALTLGIPSAGMMARVSRSAFLEVLPQNYIRTTRAKGLQERFIIWRHTMKNALIPILSLVGTDISRLITGTMIVESVFSWPGIGKYGYDALFYKDMPALQATVLVLAVTICGVNLIVDILYGLVDPRVRVSQKGGQA
ncbi:MAG TPA: ABC transporter permease [Candidatus Pullichristensenella stercorigallinarum]|uniref:ABC transporter permease n=1 Tax=Candidatus Pullichristensenella stercorigallinarum TaxID=2840909 RepID=A0A9D1CX51_9FIRM|nr:ABC transporter permease [Candidatus Pullichristensenella stercorigallinarum]